MKKKIKKAIKGTVKKIIRKVTKAKGKIAKQTKPRKAGKPVEDKEVKALLKTILDSVPTNLDSEVRTPTFQWSKGIKSY